MEQALEVAAVGLRCGEVPIGCVFVLDDGQVLAAKHNLTNTTRNVRGSFRVAPLTAA